MDLQKLPTEKVRELFKLYMSFLHISSGFICFSHIALQFSLECSRLACICDFISANTPQRRVW